MVPMDNFGFFRAFDTCGRSPGGEHVSAHLKAATYWSRERLTDKQLTCPQNALESRLSFLLFLTGTLMRVLTVDRQWTAKRRV